MLRIPFTHRIIIIIIISSMARVKRTSYLRPKGYPLKAASGSGGTRQWALGELLLIQEFQRLSIVAEKGAELPGR
jgi:hypothetical protein